jgi:hypothetical protein
MRIGHPARPQHDLFCCVGIVWCAMAYPIVPCACACACACECACVCVGEWVFARVCVPVCACVCVCKLHISSGCLVRYELAGALAQHRIV